MESSQDKSLPATARKLQKTRSEGQTSRSRDLSHLAVLGIGCAVVLAGGPTLLQHLRIEMRQQFTFDGATVLVPHVMLERLVSMMGLGILGVPEQQPDGSLHLEAIEKQLLAGLEAR